MTGGDILGTCFENSLFDEHRILVPPRIKGKLIELDSDGNYNNGETIAVIFNESKSHKI